MSTASFRRCPPVRPLQRERTEARGRSGPKSAQQATSRDRPPTDAALLLWERMLEEKTKHFPRCVGSSRISVGARRATPGPCVSGSVDIPVLQHSASARVAQDRSGIGMPSGYLPAMHLLLCAHRSHRLLKNLTAVVWMHGSVAIAVKNNGRDRWPVN
jgi:hypothetical protein